MACSDPYRVGSALPQVCLTGGQRFEADFKPRLRRVSSTPASVLPLVDDRLSDAATATMTASLDAADRLQPHDETHPALYAIEGALSAPNRRAVARLLPALTNQIDMLLTHAVDRWLAARIDGDGRGRAPRYRRTGVARGRAAARALRRLVPGSPGDGKDAAAARYATSMPRAQSLSAPRRRAACSTMSGARCSRSRRSRFPNLRFRTPSCSISKLTSYDAIADAPGTPLERAPRAASLSSLACGERTFVNVCASRRCMLRGRCSRIALAAVSRRRGPRVDSLDTWPPASRWSSPIVTRRKFSTRRWEASALR